MPADCQAVQKQRHALGGDAVAPFVVPGMCILLERHLDHK